MKGLACVVCLLVFVGLAKAQFGEYNNNRTLDENYIVHWEVDGNTLYLGLEVETFGWIGFGFGEDTTGGMKGADIVIFEMLGTEPRLSDRYALKKVEPVEDACQDYTLESFETTESKTIVHISRPLETGDPSDRPILPGGTRIVFAYGNQFQPAVGYHAGNRGASVIEFIPPVIIPPTLPPGTMSAEFFFDNVEIPAEDTNYLCASFELPPVTEDHHIIQIDPLLDPNTVDYTHHMLVQICNSNTNSYWKYYNDNPGESCLEGGHSDSSTSSPEDSMGCLDYLYVWAVGMGPLYIPKEAGYRMGPTAARYVVIQFHYTNPELKTGIKDSSGFRIHYTPDLRDEDVGLLVVGDPAIMFPNIPPGVADAHYEATCPEECTSTWANDIHVFADFLHMHFIGDSIWSTVYRDNEFVEEINGAQFYSYDFQQATNVDVVIKKGDRIHTHCVFDSTLRQNPTKFDLASTDEMCMDFLFYYPKLDDMAGCGYASPEHTLCGSQLINVANPVVEEPTRDRPRTHFGDECSSDGDDKTFYEKTWFIAVVVAGVGAIALVAIAVVAFLIYRSRASAAYESV
eukprot:TRINITY_DN6011_c0_g1_i1.p1 TRINITY_DN6011_c0_g1~~TRINITY_DN6011_c0_g1_i1.p1  ORF type:complete len:580 (-),score=77.66 TRINITY_DN6011_c0_g1_i1:95-1807(-)